MQGVLQFLKGIFINRNEDLTILGKLVKIVIIFLLVRIAIRVLNALINRTMERRNKLRFGMDDRKANTLAAILKNLGKYVFYFIGLVPALELFGIKTTSILATAGIGGLAIGFGAQSLVKDVITGFFILFEDQFSVGDYVKIDGYEGIVEEMGLRVTKVRGFSGELYIIPNSNIQIVTNSTKGAMRALVEVSISYEEDIDKAIKVLEDISKKLKDREDSIVEGPTVLGISKLGEYEIGLTIVAKTKPMEQWRIERLLRKEIKEAFDNNNIEIPYPKRVVIEKKA
ncbi:mechanosensitive ion channel family protein [Anaerosalibacter bizertensis]|uniref:Mechanosensitive ion channel family protein n=1 Tax=Anaerosalibacter bizertensis TaxID=932217 RepID=A0A844FHK3_9FIRM|nr:mechanosensitive ion channel family protein [Anaerosalibacter bizertensis]MBV1817927.1 mechanosensitive ion channel family protein [Bacteroidales bacterium MSK.15.36]HHV27660.1 mechanosensitive ion channel family protein [Tissierellia bacterium]MBU5294324.1 mechanosensitive ion channel family protein [Anaerosalibacter bizertensis]MCB5559898.1 mechanosensitive ion channel family protein [Anaerosalibacter bizertensis]MCG4565003.1 mechanosensitive ion channel family protein [Anaerosalibacter b